jgi:hypothetical protein
VANVIVPEANEGGTGGKLISEGMWRGAPSCLTPGVLDVSDPSGCCASVCNWVVYLGPWVFGR